MKIDFLTPTLTVHVWKKRDQESTDELYVMYFVHIVLESSKRYAYKWSSCIFECWLNIWLLPFSCISLCQYFCLYINLGQVQHVRHILPV